MLARWKSTAMDPAGSAEDNSIDGEGLIRWAKGRRSRHDEARLREVVGRKVSSLGDADGPMMSTAGEGRRRYSMKDLRHDIDRGRVVVKKVDKKKKKSGRMVGTNGPLPVGF